ncbi:hypothetical protein BD289DRAFT_272209 [Coniella lustricola]|uniref:Uncharacterized protein n=1 Tax=Coniella lustricola TaxID=2025994 RepID=A0A2T3AKI1_9PEZI|nr:hypothetical protein BD289DRAFT_272209 [Coniella lustricola]
MSVAVAKDTCMYPSFTIVKFLHWGRGHALYQVWSPFPSPMPTQSPKSPENKNAECSLSLSLYSIQSVRVSEVCVFVQRIDLSDRRRRIAAPPSRDSDCSCTSLPGHSVGAEILGYGEQMSRTVAISIHWQVGNMLARQNRPVLWIWICCVGKNLARYLQDEGLHPEWRTRQ